MRVFYAVVGHDKQTKSIQQWQCVVTLYWEEEERTVLPPSVSNGRDSKGMHARPIMIKWLNDLTTVQQSTYIHTAVGQASKKWVHPLTPPPPPFRHKKSGAVQGGHDARGIRRGHHQGHPSKRQRKVRARKRHVWEGGRGEGIPGLLGAVIL